MKKFHRTHLQYALQYSLVSFKFILQISYDVVEKFRGCRPTIVVAFVLSRREGMRVRRNRLFFLSKTFVFKDQIEKETVGEGKAYPSTSSPSKFRYLSSVLIVSLNCFHLDLRFILPDRRLSSSNS